MNIATIQDPKIRRDLAKLAVLKGRDELVRDMLVRAGENPDQDGILGALRKLIERAGVKP
jgi:hypothetical protein